MKKFIYVLLVLSLIAIPLLTVEAQEIRTRQYTPTIRQADYTAPQSSSILWVPSKLHIVMDAYTISANTNQVVTLAASNTIVKVHCGASRPVVSPGAFLWKGIRNEAIRITTQFGGVSVTLTGYEED